MLYILTLILCVVLITLSVIDIRSYRLPDILTLPLIALGLGQSFLLGTPWLDSLLGAAIAYVTCVLIEVGYKHIRGRDGLGRGDAKLLAAGGAWCGWFYLPFIILIASGVGLIAAFLIALRKGQAPTYLPFGPFLALGIGCVWWVIKFGFYSV